MRQDESGPLLPSPEDLHTEQYGTTESGTEAQKRAEPSTWTYIVLISPMVIGVFLTSVDSTVVLTSYASIGSDLDELQKASWISTSYLLTVTSFKPLYGKLSDIFGRKSCLLSAYIIFSLGCLLCGLSQTMNQLIVSRALAGIGGGGMSTVVAVIISDIVPLRSRGTWQGILNIVFAVGNAAGASFGGFFADTIGWRWSFLIQVPLMVLAITSVIFSLHLPKVESGNLCEKMDRVDWAGALVLIITIFHLLIGLDRGGDIGWSDIWAQYSILGFLFFGTLLVFIEFKWAREPFAPKKILLHRSLMANYMVNGLGMATTFIFLFHVPLYLQAVMSKTASQTSMSLIYSGTASTIASLGGGLIVQKTGRYFWLTLSAYIILLLGSVVISAGAKLGHSELIVTLGLALMSCGNGAGLTTTLVSVIANAGQEDQAIATAMCNLFKSLGLSLGSTVLQTNLKSTLRERVSVGDIDELLTCGADWSIRSWPE